MAIIPCRIEREGVLNVTFREAVMSDTKSLSFDEDDFPVAPQPRKGTPGLLWAIIGVGGLVVIIVVVFLIYASRRATEVRFAELARAEAEESATEARAVHNLVTRPKGLWQEAPRGPAEEILRDKLPDRLKEARLDPVVRDAKWFWSFSNERFVLDAGKELLPSDLQIALLGHDLKASRVEGKWNLEDDNRKLAFFDMQVDGKEKPGWDAKLAIGPAGPIRVNLGSYQYNIIPQNLIKQ
jgi:hypothetical protein